MDLRDIIPGYREAVEKEHLIRDAAFLPVNEQRYGFHLRPMTLRDYIILRMAKNPLLYGGVPSPGHLVDFLWLLSPSYRPGRILAKWRLKRRIRNRLLPPGTPFLCLRPGLRWKVWTAKRWKSKAEKRLLSAAKVVEWLHECTAEWLQDMPAPSGQGFQADYYSDGAAMCGRLGREYGYAEERVLSMPMTRLLQYLNEIRCANGKRASIVNPSDKIKLAWQTAQNRK